MEILCPFTFFRSFRNEAGHHLGQKFLTNRFVGNFLQPTYKIDI
jgi:hypothetical protein